MGLEAPRSPVQRGYINPLAFPHSYVLQHAQTLDRSRDGKIEDEYFAASLNKKFEFANFARDFLRVARDLENSNPYIRGMVIRTCVQHQGYGLDTLSNKNKGNIHHEHRRYVEGARSTDFMEIFEEERRKWSHQISNRHPEQLTYYGAVDTTADFFSTVAKEAKTHPEILRDSIYNEDLQRRITVAQSAKAAINWVTRNIILGPITVDDHNLVEDQLHKRGLDRYIPFYENAILRRTIEAKARVKELTRKITRQPRAYLLESQRTNGLGIYFQNITDGGLSTMHTSPGLEGLVGNYHKPVAYLEVQIGAINALEHAAEMYPTHARKYKKLAQKVRESTLREFYMPEKKYFAAAVDRDEVTGKRRKVEALSIMGASILNSDLFDNMPEGKKREYLQPIVEHLLSPDFITDIGLRTKSKEHAALISNDANPTKNAAEYQGSWTVWPALNEDIILGLRRQGFHDAAEQLENRLVNFVHANSNAEYGFVIPGTITVDGKKVNLEGVTEPINYKSKEEFDSLPELEQKRLIEGKKIIEVIAPLPQGDQLWTASAMERIEYDRGHGLAKSTDPSSWQHEVEQIIFSQSDWKHVAVMGESELKHFSNGSYFFIIDALEGGKMEERIREQSEQRRRKMMGIRRTGFAA